MVILVHGTFALNTDWHRPDHVFYKTLENHVRKHGHLLIPFVWSGQLSDKARERGAQNLTQLILSYPDNEPIILIGHSHGGNVIYRASQLLNDPVERYMERHSPQEQLHDLDIVLDAAYDHVISKSRHRTILKKEFPIDEVYTLGTPVNTTTYMPDMNIIKKVFHLFSKNDRIQSVGSLYQTTLPPHKRIINIATYFLDNQHTPYAPSHQELHHNIIAASLLDLSELTKTCSSNMITCVFSKESPVPTFLNTKR